MYVALGSKSDHVVYEPSLRPAYDTSPHGVARYYTVQDTSAILGSVFFIITVSQLNHSILVRTQQAFNLTTFSLYSPIYRRCRSRTSRTLG